MIERIRHIGELLSAELPGDEFAVLHSAWLALMVLRPNGDLDVAITSKLRRDRFPGFQAGSHFGLPGKLEKRIRIFPTDHAYGSLFGCRGMDDLVQNHSLVVEGIRFVEPRFYFELKERRLAQAAHRYRQNRTPPWRLLREKDATDLRMLRWFFRTGQHRRREFEMIPSEAWGQLVNCNHESLLGHAIGIAERLRAIIGSFRNPRGES